MKNSTLNQTNTLLKACVGALAVLTANVVPAASLNIATKWNLVGYYNDAGSVAVANVFNDKTKVSTVWKWNNLTDKWVFYTPQLDDGGQAYAATKGYEFLSTLNSGDGFWVNATASFTANLTPSSSTPTSQTAEGYYEGTFSSSASSGVFSAIVLEDGQMWSIYGQPNASTGGVTIYGANQANGKTVNGAYSATDLKDYYYNGQVFSGSVSVPKVNGVALNGTISYSNGSAVNLQGTKPSSTYYDYNSAAKLSDVSGSWSGFGLSGSTDSINISSTGQFSVAVATGCVTSASLTPRASGKNVFDLSVNFPLVAACGTYAGANWKGIAVSSLRNDGKRSLTAAFVNADRSLGSAFFGAR